MKKIFLIFLIGFFPYNIFSQKNINLIVVGEDGERFYLILNGIKYNIKAENNVKVSNLNSGTYEAEIAFDGDVPSIKDKIYTIWDNKPTDNKEFTYVVEKKKSGYRIRFLGMEEIANPADTLRVQPPDTSTAVKKECKGPMPDKQFVVASQAVGARNVEDSRLSMAKGFLEKNCFTSKQIKDICDMFEYDQTRFDFLKYAYDSCTDKPNYKDLMLALDYKKSRKDFDDWLKTK